MRRAAINRETKETKIKIKIDIDGRGKSKIVSEIGFLNHMLETLAKHGLFDIVAELNGDTKVDQHHLIEDTGIALGQALNKALGTKRGIKRMGFFACPMDDALAECTIDLSGRPYLRFDARFRSKKVGDLNTGLIEDFLQGVSLGLGATLHIKIIYGRSDHHKVEAMFKALARALKEACTIEKRHKGEIPSTKGRL